MRKSEERGNPQSCWNKASDDDIVFVILESGPAAPGTIRDWCRRRVALGKNKPEDNKITGARSEAALIEGRRGKPPHIPDGEILARYNLSCLQARIGGAYVHTNTGGVYYVLVTSIDADSGVALVTYRNQKTGMTWTRPLEEFIEVIGPNGMRRFEPMVSFKV